MTRKALCGLLLGACFTTVGCGGDDDPEFSANVAGAYTVALTTRNANVGSASCPFGAAMVNEMSVGVRFDIIQNGNALTGTVSDGLSALGLGLSVGTNVFQGSVSGETIRLAASGTVTHRQGNCAYFVNVTIDGGVLGDSIYGTVVYTPDTNGAADCTGLECTVTQEFSGSRPPT